MQKHSFVLLFCRDLIITFKKCFCISYFRLQLSFRKNGETQTKAFIEFCESVHVSQSMSKAGYPYDNAPMERYFNTLKNECTNLYEFRTEEELYQTVEEFAYVTYNHVRPHSYNGYSTPHQARMKAWRVARAAPAIRLPDHPESGMAIFVKGAAA